LLPALHEVLGALRSFENRVPTQFLTKVFGEIRVQLLEDVLETAIGVLYVQGFVFPLLLRILSKLVAFDQPLLLLFGDGVVGVGATGWVGALEGAVRKLGALLVAVGRGRGGAVLF